MLVSVEVMMFEVLISFEALVMLQTLVKVVVRSGEVVGSWMIQKDCAFAACL